MIWSYPIINPTLSIMFRHAVRSSNNTRNGEHQRDKTCAAIPVIQAPRIIIPRATYQFSNMNDAEKTAMESFFDTVTGMVEQFKISFLDGRIKTCRFGEPELKFDDRPGGTYSLSVIIMEL